MQTTLHVQAESNERFLDLVRVGHLLALSKKGIFPTLLQKFDHQVSKVPAELDMLAQAGVRHPENQSGLLPMTRLR